ncbi:MAG: c-type cytochrome [Sphingomonas sp.]|nr:c-type cytochrome [Sphingomonas sp.]MBW0007235.1 c-type cytochrome [Sphingomonas sp.]
MSSRFRVSLLVLGVGALALTACDREERHSRSKPIGETVPAGPSPDTIWPGGTVPQTADPRAKLYDNNAAAISEGQYLYTQMNCVGCHFHGGGGMGPPLMDDEWRYGGRIDQIATSIAEGRPNGMPAWRSKLTEDQIWKIAAFVRSLSGQPSKDAVSSRAESMSAGTPQTLTAHERLHNSDTADQ